ncbi:MAG: hydroxyacid dehydrogenase [Deltaproteobacteria bacterium]|jgi:D-3-phosphoglycerate dehydrogenase|nr:hydroxyacid dehydrogenase [Deltaproteobacteria bacterium]
MPPTVLLSDKIESVCPETLKKAGIAVVEKSGLSPSDLEKEIGQYDGLVVRSATTVTRGVLEKGKAGALKIVGRAGAGLDNIDGVAAQELGIKVVNTPGLNANAVAELTVALAIVLARKLDLAFSSTKAGRWEKKNLVGTELSGKVIGLVGFGYVGRLVAKKAVGLDMTVWAYDPFLKPETLAQSQATAKTLDEIWTGADYVSLHLPKTPETVNLVNEAVIAKLKKGAILLNCARGGLVDEKALYQALKSGHLAGAALDVFATEPPADNPLLTLDNFVATPHVGASTLEAQLNVAEEVARLLVDFLKPGA